MECMRCFAWVTKFNPKTRFEETGINTDLSYFQISIASSHRNRSHNKPLVTGL